MSEELNKNIFQNEAPWTEELDLVKEDSYERNEIRFRLFCSKIFMENVFINRAHVIHSLIH